MAFTSNISEILRQLRQRRANTGVPTPVNTIEAAFRGALNADFANQNAQERIRLAQEGLDIKRQSIKDANSAAKLSGIGQIGTSLAVGGLAYRKQIGAGLGSLKDTITSSLASDTATGLSPIAGGAGPSAFSGTGVDATLRGLIDSSNMAAANFPLDSSQMVAGLSGSAIPSGGAVFNSGVGGAEVTGSSLFGLGSTGADVSSTGLSAVAGGAGESAFAGGAGIGSTAVSAVPVAGQAAVGGSIGALAGRGIGNAIGGSEAAKDAGSVTGGLVGGAAIGAYAGSVVPGIGTAVGAVIGGLIGGAEGGASAASVICTELNRQGLLPTNVMNLDAKFALKNISAETYIGYVSWARYVVKAMKHSKLITYAVAPIGRSWAYEMASRMSPKYTGNRTGKFLLKVGVPICTIIGRTYVKLFYKCRPC